MIGEEILLIPDTGKVLAAQRKFKGSCQECGDRLHIEMGHHSTLNKKSNRRLFSDKIAARLNDFLTAEQRKRFNEFRNGWLVVEEQQIAEWERLVVRYGLYLWSNEAEP